MTKRRMFVYVVSVALGLYHICDRIMQIAKYGHRHGLPFTLVDYLTNDLLLGSRDALPISGGVPKSYFIFGVIMWTLFVLANFWNHFKANIFVAWVVILFCLTYCLYLLLTILEIFASYAMDDSLFPVLLISRFLLFVVFATISVLNIQQLKKI